VALDAAGHSLGTSATRDFRVDGTPPQVTSVTPTTLKPSSIIKTTFSEQVHGVSGTTMKLYKVNHGKRTPIKATVKLGKSGRTATLDPKHRLKHGHYLLVFTASRIKDRAGNALVPSSVTPALRSSLTALR
jgi:hypothetical protein